MGAQTETVPSVDAPRPRFARSQPFRRELTTRVNRYFADAGLSRAGGAAIWGKTITMLTWLVGSYVALVWLVETWWQAALAGSSLALAIGGTAMAIHHDANHGAFSRRGWVNSVVKRALDALGVSSYIWGWTHNVFHHTYTNIDGVDQDVDLGSLARLAPAQSRRWFHAYQHLYMWPVYGFTIFYFVLAEDLIQLHRAKVGPHRFPAPRGLELVGVFASKLFVVGWALLIPLLYHPWWLVLPVFAAVWFVAGFILGLTFQVAHLVPEASFPRSTDESPNVEDEWAVHQVASTADFAHGNKLVTWYVGGLNYQIEHHLFPRICHVHYPALAPIVEQTCRDFGLDYTVYPGVGAAIGAHARWLVQMGRSTPRTSPATA